MHLVGVIIRICHDARSHGRKTLIYVYRSSHKFSIILVIFCGPGSVVGVATGYGLDGPGIESWWGARFSAPVETGLGAHPASCTMGTGSFPG